jgi:hypothetical protein
MRLRDQAPRHVDTLEARLVFDATWIVIPPGVGEAVVQQTVPLVAAREGLVGAAAQANATAGSGFNCWVVRFDAETPG